MNVDIHRVTDLDGWARCEPLFADYVAWVLGELAARGVATRADQAESVARGFADEAAAVLGPRGRLLLATLEREPAGVVALVPAGGADGEVKRLYVAPPARGAGIASSLMERVISDARALGYARLRLETHRYMAGALALYARLGFVETAPFPRFEGDAYGLGAITVFQGLDLAAAGG